MTWAKGDSKCNVAGYLAKTKHVCYDSGMPPFGERALTERPAQVNCYAQHRWNPIVCTLPYSLNVHTILYLHVQLAMFLLFVLYFPPTKKTFIGA